MANFISDFFENRGWLGLVQQNPTTGALEVGGVAVTGATEYTLAQFLVLDPADYNGYTVRVTDVDAPHATAGGVLARCEDNVWNWLQTPTFTVATVPTAAAASGWRIFVSDIGGRGSYWYSNGTRFNLDQESVVLSNMTSGDIVLSPTPTAFAVARQVSMPLIDGKSIWSDGDILEVSQYCEKTGSADIMNNAVYIGATSLSANDAESGSSLGNYAGAAGNTGLSVSRKIIRKSATSIRLLGPTVAPGNGGAGAATTNVTVSSLDSAAAYIRASLKLSTSTGDSALTLVSHTVRLISAGAV